MTSVDWEWSPYWSGWVSVPSEVTWGIGATIDLPASPVGSRVEAYVVPAAEPASTAAPVAGGPYASRHGSFDAQIAATSAGSGLLLLVQQEALYAQTVVPDPDLAPTLSGFTSVEPYHRLSVDDWRWSDVWGGWVGPAYRVTWQDGDTFDLSTVTTLPPGVLRLDLMGIPGEAPSLATSGTGGPMGLVMPGFGGGPLQVSTTAAVGAGSGIYCLIITETDFAHSAEVPAPLYVLDYLGDLTLVGSYDLPDFLPPPPPPKPVVTFADPEVAIRTYLADQFTGLLVDEMPDYIKADPPNLPLGERTYVQVQLDGTPSSRDYPMTERATVRINCCTGAGHRSAVKALASLVMALVSAHPGDDDVYGTRALLGRSAVITDPDTKNLMCWVLFRVNLRPTPVSI